RRTGYYKILGVSREYTEIEIKKAYRRESLIHHPDKGGDEEKFKLVVEANAVLSDPKRRERYDLGEDEDGMNEGGGMGGMGGGFGGMSPMDMEELFASFGGGARFGGVHSEAPAGEEVMAIAMADSHSEETTFFRSFWGPHTWQEFNVHPWLGRGGWAGEMEPRSLAYILYIHILLSSFFCSSFIKFVMFGEHLSLHSC
ncbi:DnaJ domain-containing protein, partial [Flammula alnicola]